jgi:ribosomal protein L37AE/L43A
MTCETCGIRKWNHLGLDIREYNGRWECDKCVMERARGAKMRGDFDEGDTQHNRRRAVRRAQWQN